jgi:hypothetical protein
MNKFLKVMTVLAKAVADRFLGESRTDELVAVLKEYRDAPASPAEVSAPEATTQLADVTEEQRVEVATLLTSAAAGVKDVLADLTLTPVAAAERLLEQFPDRDGTYLIWLNAPPLEGFPCFVHFYWEQREGRSHAFSVRDYVNGVFYYGHRDSVPRPDPILKRVVEWKDRTAAEVWGMSRKHQRCTTRNGTRFSTTEGPRWKELLEEMTRTKALSC